MLINGVLISSLLYIVPACWCGDMGDMGGQSEASGIHEPPEYVPASLTSANHGVPGKGKLPVLL